MEREATCCTSNVSSFASVVLMHSICVCARTHNWGAKVPAFHSCIYLPLMYFDWAVYMTVRVWLYEDVCVCARIIYIQSAVFWLFVFVCLLCVIVMPWIIFYIGDVLLCLLLPNEFPHRDNKAVFYGVHTLPDRTAWGLACWSPASAASFSYIPERPASQSESSFWVTTNQKLELHNNHSETRTA